MSQPAKELGEDWVSGLVNIVMLMTDDTGWNDFGCYLGLGHPTPNVDQMAKEGRGLLEHFFERDWGDKYAKQQQASGTITK